MLSILTPSKTMDFNTPAPTGVFATELLFAEQSAAIRARVGAMSYEQLQEMMHISAPLARTVQAQYADQTEKAALWAYTGDVFRGFQAHSLSAEAIDFAQQAILIPSGLYGLVRPLDAIKNYRLEMKTKLLGAGESDLYTLWGGRLATYAASRCHGELLLLTSQEYARAITPHLPGDCRVVTPAFIDRKPNGVEQQVAIYNKMMRGVMARWVVDQRRESIADVVQFSGHGYQYSPERSSPDRPVFYRTEMRPLSF